MAEHDATTLWTSVLDALQNRVASGTFDMFFRPLQPLDAVTDASGGIFLLLAPNAYFREWVSSHYGTLIEEQLLRITDTRWTLHWTVPTGTENRPSSVPATSATDSKRPAAPARNVRTGPPALRKPVPTAGAPLRQSVNAPVVPASVLAALGQGSAREAATATATHASSTATTSLTSRPALSSMAPAHAMGLAGAAGSTRAIETPSTRTVTSSATRSMGAATLSSASTGTVSAGGPIGKGLHPKYTFDNFVMGPSNQLAYGAALAASELSGRRFNPLFLYGTTGLGKTHLVNAIGHKVLMQMPNAQIMYVSAEQFTNEFVAALSSKTMDAFRARYREHCDVLLIDDVQFFAGRVQTEEEFFHTFNALYLKERPIVLTSDVAPQELSGMAERLVSRFSSGLVADVYPPELETRIAIVRKKSELEGITIDDEAAYLLANSITTNVRQLEGMLIKLSIQAGLAKRSGIDGNLVRETLRIPTRHAIITVDDVQRSVADHYRIKMKDLVGKERHQGIALPRAVAMYLCRERLGVSFPQIGARFGGKDHTTVIAACHKIKKLLEQENTVKKDIEIINSRIGVVGGT